MALLVAYGRCDFCGGTTAPLPPTPLLHPDYTALPPLPVIDGDHGFCSTECRDYHRDGVVP